MLGEDRVVTGYGVEDSTGGVGGMLSNMFPGYTSPDTVSASVSMNRKKYNMYTGSAYNRQAEDIRGMMGGDISDNFGADNTSGINYYMRNIAKAADVKNSIGMGGSKDAPIEQAPRMGSLNVADNTQLDMGASLDTGITPEEKEKSDRLSKKNKALGIFSTINGIVGSTIGAIIPVVGVAAAATQVGISAVKKSNQKRIDELLA